jgi:Fur family ferric uptake transcriptional regulator
MGGFMEKERFRDFLSTKGLKLTKERNEILDEILSIKKHFDPEELFIKLKQKGSKVSRASVYRTIPLLLESGIIEEVEKIDRHAHYEKVSSNEHHDHMICLKCGKIIEFFSPTLEMLQNEICEKERFKCIKHFLEIHGYCKDCRNQ